MKILVLLVEPIGIVEPIGRHVNGNIKKGYEYKRKELHIHFSGQRHRGISTSRSHPIIFIFTSKLGKDYVYVDGCDEGGYFFYPGVVQKGNIKF